MQAQAYEGYFESGKFYTAGGQLRIPERCKIYITIFNEPANNIPQTSAPKWLSELHELLEESGDEKLNMEDFPRMDIEREPIIFCDER